MGKLILLRHGESMWNEKNLFTGWVDVPLSEKGVQESINVGALMRDMPIDVIFSSTLIRAIMTAMIVMAYHSSKKTPVLVHEAGLLKEYATIHSENTKAETIPVFCDDALNERMYGGLQGMNKQEMQQKYGNEQVHIWRRSFAVCPPHGESLELTTKRTIPYFEKTILPFLQAGKNVFISAHGNSLRAIIKVLNNLSDEEVVALELATGVPIVYEYEKGQFTKDY